jgi:hypothetical protein
MLDKDDTFYSVALIQIACLLYELHDDMVDDFCHVVANKSKTPAKM